MKMSHPTQPHSLLTQFLLFRCYCFHEFYVITIRRIHPSWSKLRHKLYNYFYHDNNNRSNIYNIVKLTKVEVRSLIRPRHHISEQLCVPLNILHFFALHLPLVSYLLHKYCSSAEI